MSAVLSVVCHVDDAALVHDTGEGPPCPSPCPLPRSLRIQGLRSTVEKPFFHRGRDALMAVIRSAAATTAAAATAATAAATTAATAAAAAAAATVVLVTFD